MAPAVETTPAAELSQQDMSKVVWQLAMEHECLDMVHETHRQDWKGGFREPFSVLEVPKQSVAACTIDQLFEFNIAACCIHKLTVQEQACLLLRGVQHLLVDRQQLAKFLSSNSPDCRELLQAYASLWEAEWRLSWLSVLQAAKTSTEDNRGSSVTRKTRRFSMRILCGTDTLQEDNKNGNMFVDAMRSFFSEALHMAHLEADEVQRLIEAFVEALISDASFLRCLSASMYSERERLQTIRQRKRSSLG